MMHTDNARPPRWALAFFRWFCHPEYLEDIEGDLLERFHERAARVGAGEAKWQFTKDVLLLFRPGIIGDLTSRSPLKFFNMEKFNWVKLLGLNLIFILLVVFQFLPGPPNKVAQAFSIGGQVVGISGLLLAPVGLAWIIIEIRRMRNPGSAKNLRASYQLAVGVPVFLTLISLLWALFMPGMGKKIVGVPILLMLPLGLFLGMNGIKRWNESHGDIGDRGPSYILAMISTVWLATLYLLGMLGVYFGVGKMPGILGFLLLPFGINWASGKLRELKEGKAGKWNMAPYYLLTVPLTILLAVIYLVKPVSNYSRDFAIKRSQELIATIEDYKNITGAYPDSLQQLESHYTKKIPSPFIMGIEHFKYQKISDYYTLSFVQWQALGSVEEIVQYDKYDRHPIKGAFASYGTRHDHWRYYWLD